MIVELSLTVSERLAVYPGVTKTAYEPRRRMDRGDLNNATYVRHFLHTGTHADAPYHFDNDGTKIDEIPIERFVYSRPLLVSVPKSRGELITPADVRPWEDELRAADLVLFDTGYARHVSDEATYTDDFPALNIDLARMLRDDYLNVVAVGIDTVSMESVHGREQGFPVHRQLLHHETSSNRPLLLFELVNTAALGGRNPRAVWALPIRFEATEAAPIAMIAEVD